MKPKQVTYLLWDIICQTFLIAINIWSAIVASLHKFDIPLFFIISMTLLVAYQIALSHRFQENIAQNKYIKHYLERFEGLAHFLLIPSLFIFIFLVVLSDPLIAVTFFSILTLSFYCISIWHYKVL